MFVEFVTQNQYFSFPLEVFAQILRIPCEGACVFSDRCSLDELVYGAPSKGPYQTNLPSPDDIISFVREDREGQVTRIRHQEEVEVQDYQILTREIMSTLKPLEEIIRENVFCLGGNRDHVPTCHCYMLYCVENSEKFNLAYFMAKRMDENLERIMAREEVVIPLTSPPSINHLHLISTMMMMMEIMKGPRIQVLFHPFVIHTENEVVRLMMFSLLHTGKAKTWLNELNERTIETWDELRTTFISLFFPLALFDRLLEEIQAFSQHENKTLTDAWLRMKEILRNSHGHNLTKGNIIKIFYQGLNELTREALNVVAGGIFLYKTPNQAYQLLNDKVLLKLDWAKNLKSKPSLTKIVAFANEGSSSFDTDKIMARIDAMTIKIDDQYKEFQSCSKFNHCGGDHSTTYCNDDDTPMSREEEEKFMQTF
uniref:Reverse transcriptase domain-containing protein n=1 Tax=Tanacetum cinerariifolium TaxID=118510 RepID=A0A699GR35_TANCI|nr:reverse transcriptase domain-containing protein [Tanacetum cinerariifolium]